MGLAPDFDQTLTPYEYNLYRRGWEKAQTEKWKHTRFVAWASIAPHVREAPTLHQIMPLPGDETPAEKARRERKAKPAIGFSKKDLEEFNKAF